MNIALQEEFCYQLLKVLCDKGTLSQRELARRVGISLGKVNQLLSELARRGFILVQRISVSRNRTKYLYLLTSTGLAEKSRLALHFLKEKMREHEELKRQIRKLQAEVKAQKQPVEFKEKRSATSIR